MRWWILGLELREAEKRAGIVWTGGSSSVCIRGYPEVFCPLWLPCRKRGEDRKDGADVV